MSSAPLNCHTRISPPFVSRFVAATTPPSTPLARVCADVAANSTRLATIVQRVARGGFAVNQRQHGSAERQVAVSVKYKFVKSTFIKKPLSSKTTFITNQFHQKTIFIRNHFHQKPISSKTTFIRNHFHQKKGNERVGQSIWSVFV